MTFLRYAEDHRVFLLQQRSVVTFDVEFTVQGIHLYIHDMSSVKGHITLGAFVKVLDIYNSL